MPLVTDLPKIPAQALELAFPRDEYERRVARVRESMASRNLDILLITYVNNACYLTGYQTPLSNWYTCIILPTEGRTGCSRNGRRGR